MFYFVLVVFGDDFKGVSVAKRSIRSSGNWVDESGGVRGAALKIEIDGMTAAVFVGAPNDEDGTPLPDPDRTTAHYLSIMEQRIRAVEYAARPVETFFNETKMRKLGIRV